MSDPIEAPPDMSLDFFVRTPRERRDCIPPQNSAAPPVPRVPHRSPAASRAPLGLVELDSAIWLAERLRAAIVNAKEACGARTGSPVVGAFFDVDNAIGLLNKQRRIQEAG